MTCEHPDCSLSIFSSCTNHCTKNVCLQHLIEHGDKYLNDFTYLLDQLDKSTCTLINEINNTSIEVNYDLLKKKKKECQKKYI